MRRLPSSLFLYATAAIVGAAVLVIELVGTRLLAPWLGQSHYVWTAQISVTLSALATGYALGGRWSQRGLGIGTLYLALGGAGVALCFAVLSAGWVAEQTAAAHLVMGTFVASTTLFFVPLTLLATLSPLLAGELSRMSEGSASAPGALLGRVLAVSTAGSIGGAVLSGLVLIPRLSGAAALYGSAALLVAVAAVYTVLFARRANSLGGAVVSILTIASAWTFWPQPGHLVPLLSEELERVPSAYGLLQVLRERPGPRLFLMNDNLIQAAWDTDDRKSTAVFADLVLAVLRGFQPHSQRILCIGLGAGIIPMALVADGAQVDVVEINAGMERLAARWFEYRPDRVSVQIADGRTFVRRSHATWDAIVLDAFLGESVPAHLVTVEALQDARAHLRPGGLLVIDVFGPPPGGNDVLVNSLSRTLAAVFADVRAYQVLGNTVFAAADRLAAPLHVDVSGSHRYNRAVLEYGLTHPVSFQPQQGLLLTDRFNPIDVREAENAMIRRRAWTADISDR